MGAAGRGGVRAVPDALLDGYRQHREIDASHLDDFIAVQRIAFDLWYTGMAQVDPAFAARLDRVHRWSLAMLDEVEQPATLGVRSPGQLDLQLVAVVPSSTSIFRSTSSGTRTVMRPFPRANSTSLLRASDVGQGVEPGRRLLATQVLGLVDVEQVHVSSSGVVSNPCTSGG